MVFPSFIAAFNSHKLNFLKPGMEKQIPCCLDYASMKQLSKNSVLRSKVVNTGRFQKEAISIFNCRYKVEKIPLNN